MRSLNMLQHDTIPKKMNTSPFARCSEESEAKQLSSTENNKISTLAGTIAYYLLTLSCHYTKPF